LNSGPQKKLVNLKFRHRKSGPNVNRRKEKTLIEKGNNVNVEMDVNIKAELKEYNILWADQPV
jgi:hypothetical protein